MGNNTPPATAAAAAVAPSLLETTISIEEPITLNQSQLAFLREAALKIINSHKPEEATTIFLEKMETSGTTVATDAKVDK